MRIYQIVFIFLTLLLHGFAASSQPPGQNRIISGAERMYKYIPYIGDKPFAVVANHTSLVGNTHLVDTLTAMKYNLKKIFSPEHGFRGKAEAGASLHNSIDSITGLPVISLYGTHRKPRAEDLKDVEIVLFDIQDVGARFYTYISTLSLVMEACAENNIRLIILDRPNPHGYYVDGPVLEPGFSSFVGMHPIPIVHGMTMAEYARMVNDEGFINGYCDLAWVKCKNYSHTDHYSLPVKPSPNLPDMQAVYLYPSLCLFEGTVVSIGRGTDFPFRVYGHPDMKGPFSFVPQPNAASSHPKHAYQRCYGENLTHKARAIKNKGQIRLVWLLEAYKQLADSTAFFTPYFTKLAGTTALQAQIEAGLTAKEIRQSWEPKLSEFKKLRKKYLLYPDFDE